MSDGMRLDDIEKPDQVAIAVCYGDFLGGLKGKGAGEALTIASWAATAFYY